MAELKSLCVFCGSKSGDDGQFGETARALGEALAKNGTELVYGGGEKGLMGITASAARDAGGEVYGVIPRFLTEIEGILEDIHHEVVETMHERKMLMFDRSDAICALPGGIGTLEEIVELLSWRRLNLHRKPLILCNVEGYWHPFVTLLQHMVDRGFADPELMTDIVEVDGVEGVIPAATDRLLRHRV
ncbi:hypothetical protein PB2503_08644 [Parvularcula bermudensis HTCC2503]|uniref:Cytokinin riboside 5'-monophosphate phosphoribohydrolase n=1 Tax=Parvularcula bermudensis (strain ATCC BAA-594 / HTCC2503 / KCTC 12087) TaxID=314260 RepID=E0TBR3_PARBH|nr:TIGR00730 family Rossman fold protein [Parvularcula bermudensis]ADM09784.1 hypothetical protein PB2503_08644 [Parvularcula bermudensis HTCC2503]